jgi:cytochrome c2
LLTAIAFWAALFDVRRSGWSYGSGVLYVFGTAVHTSILGALMTLAPVGWYPRYADTTQQWGLSPLEDQQLAGLIMWVPAGLMYTVVALILLAAWLRASETRVRRPRWVTTVVLCGVLLAGACDWPPGVTRQALDARSAAGLTGGASSEGRRTIERYGCGGCHTISGIRGANGLVGPPLNGIGKRLYIGGVITNTPENMARWIQDPKAVDSLTVMPRLGVTLDQARDITAYLYTLK